MKHFGKYFGKQQAVFAILLSASILILSAVGVGCQALNKFDPADTGNPAAQVAQAVSHATTQPIVQGVGAVATGATGFPVSAVIAGVGGLAAVLAGVFGSKYGGSQAKLDVAAAAAGVTTHAAAIANLVSSKNPTVAKVEQDVSAAAGAVAAVAPAVGQIVPSAAPVASDVGTLASAVQGALLGGVTITSMGSSPIKS